MNPQNSSTEARPRARESDYMEWAKQLPPQARYSLAASGIRPVTREELGLKLEDIELVGPNEYGDPELRAGLAGRYGVTAENCLIAEGASGVNAMVAGALIRPGDRVLVEVPGYGPLARISEFFGAETVPLPRRFEDNFAVDEDVLERELRRGVRLVWLTNLHNPSGVRMPDEVLERLHSRIAGAGAYMVMDEVYREYVPGLRSAARLGPRVIVTSSLTKIMGLPGLRIGWAIGDADFVADALRLHGIFSAQTAYPSVCIARAALPRMDWLIERARAFAAEGRAIFEAWLEQHPQLREVRPAGGLVTFPRLPAGTDDRAFVRRLMEEHETLAVPGSYFSGPGHLRLGLGAPREELTEALNRLGAVLRA